MAEPEMGAPEEVKRTNPARAVLQAATGEVVQRSVQLLPTGTNVKMWAKYGEMAMKAEILYVALRFLVVFAGSMRKHNNRCKWLA